MSTGRPDTTATRRAALPGRRAELELLGRELARARQGEMRFVALVGAAGVGKTRLLQEMADTADAVALGLPLPPERLGPEDLLEHWLAPLLRTVRRRVEARDLALAASAYPRLAELSPVADVHPIQRVTADRAIAAIARVMAHAAERRPLLLLVDDLPRLRDEVRTLVAGLAIALVSAPVAFLISARLEPTDPLRDRALTPLIERHLLRRVDVQPLDEAGLRELIASELDEAVAPTMLPWLYSRSRGNALFAVELIRALEGQGLLYVDRATGHWRLAGLPEHVRLPATIAHVLDSRRQALAPDLAHSLPYLALLGADAPLPLLAQVLEVDEAAMCELLERLVRAGVLQSHDGDRAFNHPLMAEHWQQTLGDSERCRVAKRALDYILDAVQERAESLPALRPGSCATGLEQAQDHETARILSYAEICLGVHDPTASAPSAAAYLLAAIELGRRSFRGQRMREAAGWSRRATRQLRRIDDPVEGRWFRAQLDLLMGSALVKTGRLKAAEGRLRRFMDSPEAADLGRGVYVFTRLGQLLNKRGDLLEARRVLERGLAVLRSQDAPVARMVRCDLLCFLAWGELCRGDLDAAEGCLARASAALGDLATDPRATQSQAHILHNRAILAAKRGEFRRAIAAFEELVRLDRQSSGWSHPEWTHNLAFYLALVGDLRSARPVAREALRHLNRHDDRFGTAAAWTTLGFIESGAGNWRGSCQSHERARLIAEQSGNWDAWFFAMGELTRVYMIVDGAEASDRTWREAMAASETLAALSPEVAAHLYWTRGWVHCRCGDWERALECCEQARSLARGAGNEHQRVLAELLAVESEIGRCLGAGVGTNAESSDQRESSARPRARTSISGSSPSIDRDVLKGLAERLDTLEAYLRKECLRHQLVDLARLRLHLSLAGWQRAEPASLVDEIHNHLIEMGAAGRRAAIARVFASTSIAALPRFQQVFAPALIEAAQASTTEPRAAVAATEPDSVAIGLLACDISPNCVRIRTLGRLQVMRVGDNKPLTRADWGSRKARVLLAYLLAADLAGRGVTREALCDAVWPEDESLVLDRTFRVTMTMLRKALRGEHSVGAQTVVFQDGLYCLPPEAYWCDAREFEDALKRAARHERHGEHAEALECRRHAFELYEGEFLADFDEFWIESRRERYRNRFVEVGKTLAGAALDAARIDEATEIAEKLVSCDPLSEEGHRLLIRTHLTAGRRDAAVRQLERCRALLQEQLHLPVSTETEALLSGTALPGPSDP